MLLYKLRVSDLCSHLYKEHEGIGYHLATQDRPLRLLPRAVETRQLPQNTLSASQ